MIRNSEMGEEAGGKVEMAAIMANFARTFSG
jgi:hypothetical protein